MLDPLRDHHVETVIRHSPVFSGIYNGRSPIYNDGGPGLVVIITEANPQGINPKILLLDLKTATLPGIWPQVLQPVPAWYVKQPYKNDTYTSIQIRYPGGKSGTIDKIIDAGKGPK